MNFNAGLPKYYWFSKWNLKISPDCKRDNLVFRELDLIQNAQKFVKYRSEVNL